MHPQTPLVSFLVISCLLFTPLLRTQDNPLNDPDLKEMLKEAQEMQKQAKELQKQNAASADTKKKLAEMLSQAKAEEARQRAEARLREKLSDEQVASVNAALTRSLVQLRVKRRRRV